MNIKEYLNKEIEPKLKIKHLIIIFIGIIIFNFLRDYILNYF
jgi:hypothetical protein